MIRRFVLLNTLVALVLTPSHAVRANPFSLGGAQADSQITAADQAPFVGEWTLALQGPDGPGSFALSVKVDKEKLTGEISSDALPRQAIREISLVNKSLILCYAFTWEGNPVEAVVSLTPADGEKMTAQIDFAGGAYIMAGTASKKESSK